jgi:uncharacterized protein
MIICYLSHELKLVRKLTFGDDRKICDTDYDEYFINKLISGDYIVEQHDNPYKLLNFIYDRHIYNSGELSITIIMSERCNFRCKYCYEGYDEQVLTDDKLSGVMRFICDFVRDCCCSSVGISWFGGEPTLFKGATLHFMRELRLKLAPEVALNGGMTTNAYLLTKDEFREYYDVGIRDYQITVDGFANTHNQLRQLKDGSGTWDNIIENLKAIHTLDYDDIHIMLRINYNDDVMQNIYEFLDFIKSMFGNKFVLHTHPITNLGGEFNDSMCSPDILADAEEKIGEYVLMNNIRSDYAERHIQIFGAICYASKPNSFVVDPYGIIRKCTVALKDEKNIVGEILDESHYFINTYKLAAWTKAQVDDSECADCCIYPVCMQRVCTNSMINRKNVCTYNKSAVFNYLGKLADLAYRRQINAFINES